MQRSQGVDVISVCNADGQIRPLRLQLQDEQHQLLRINIDEVVSVKEITHVGVWDRPWVLELKYLFRSHSWKLQRIQ